jgi:hypothetical protein
MHGIISGKTHKKLFVPREGNKLTWSQGVKGRLFLPNLNMYYLTLKTLFFTMKNLLDMYPSNLHFKF